MIDMNGWMWAMLVCMIILVVLLRKQRLAKKEILNQVTEKYHEILQEYKKTIFSTLYEKLKQMPLEGIEHANSKLIREARNDYQRSLGVVLGVSIAQPLKYKHHIGVLLDIWRKSGFLTSKNNALEEKLLEIYDLGNSYLSVTEMLCVIAREDYCLETSVKELLELISNLYKKTKEK